MIPFFILAIENEDDRQFMEWVYIEYHRLMYSEALKITRDTWVAEDAVQSALMKLIDHVVELRRKDKDHLINYVISTSKNTAIDFLRKKKNCEALSFSDEFEDCEQIQSNMDLETDLIRDDDLKHLDRIWDELSPKNRYLLEERYIQEKTTQEIAQELGIKKDSVRMALSRARREAYSLLKQE